MLLVSYRSVCGLYNKLQIFSFSIFDYFNFVLILNIHLEIIFGDIFLIKVKL